MNGRDGHYWRNLKDDDDDEDDVAYSLNTGGDAREPFLPSIRQSMMYHKVIDVDRKKLAYTKYCMERRRARFPCSMDYNRSDPLKNLVLLNGKLATKLADELAQRDTVRLLKIFLGALTTRNANSLGEAIASRPSLTHLTIRRISKEQGTRVLTQFFTAIASSQAIQKLSLQSTYEELDLKHVVSSLRSLETLYFRGVCHFPSLCEGLRRSHSLAKLEITATKMNQSKLHMLSSILPQCCSLATLNLSRTEICDECVIALLAHWTPDTPVEELNLSGNHLSGQGAVHLLRASANLPSLKTLNLNDNSKLGLSGIQMIGKELGKNHFLRQLAIRGCTPHAVRKDTLWSLTRGVKESHSLGYLDFDSREWSNQDSVKWFTALNRHGRFLLSSHHQLASTVWCRLLERCGKETSTSRASLVYYFLREQPHLVQEGERPRRKKPRRG